MKNLFVIAALVLLSGCSKEFYQRRDIKKLDALSIQQPSEFLRLSTLINPCFDGKAKSDTVTIKGKPDTSFIKGDTVTVIRHDTVIRTITLSGRQVILPEFVTIHDTVTDGRKVASLDAQLTDALQAKNISDTQKLDQAKTAKTRLAIIIALSVLICSWISIKIYKFFSGGAIASAGSSIIKKL